MFSDYKERNMKIIGVYKLLINNYDQINSIRNYNINNNIIINNSFDLSNSDFFISDINNHLDCISSKYNKLCAFYNKKNHIKTKNYSEYMITKKFCGFSKVKKCIFLDEDKIMFIFENDYNNIFYLLRYKDEGEIYKYKIVNLIIPSEKVIDIFPLKNNKFCTLREDNTLKIWEIKNEKELKFEQAYENVNYFIPDLEIKNWFFIVENTEELININFKEYRLYFHNKKYNIQYLIDDINEIINNSEIDEDDKLKFKKIFKIVDNKVNIKDLLLSFENDLIEIMQNKIKNVYNDLMNKIDIKNNNITNFNYYYTLLNELNNKDNKLDKKEIERIEYTEKLNKLYFAIRKIYTKYIVFTNKIVNIYNYNNSLIFMGDKYLFIEYNIKDKEFYPLISPNFLPDKEDHYNNYKIEYLNTNFIILNNFNKKFFYVIKYKPFLLIKEKYNYYSSIIINDQYLLFDVLSDRSRIQFSFINLFNSSLVKNNEINEILNLRVEMNNPKIMLFTGINNFISFYDENQLCYIDYKLEEENNIKDEQKNESNVIKKINIIKRYMNENIINYSKLYSGSYHPSNLFNYLSDYYYCSEGPSAYFEIDFSYEFFISKIEFYYNDSYLDCIPKNYNIQIYDNKKREINRFDFKNIAKVTNETREINEMGRYMRFNFIDNFGGNYIIIKRIYFKYNKFYDIS